MTRRRTVLVADDCSDDRALLSDAIGSSGVDCKVSMVEDGQKALEYLAGAGAFADRRRFPPPALLLLDLKMPVKDGYRTLAELRGLERWRALPVVVFSASPQPEDVERCYRLGANAYVLKPSGLEELVEMMRVLLSFWLRMNLSPVVREGG